MHYLCLVLSLQSRLRHIVGNMALQAVRETLGFRIKWLSSALYSKRPFFGLRDLDRRFISIIDVSPGFYVEIGANDGFSQSNSLALELFHGWTGLLIEPASSSFRRLRHNRSRRRNYLLNAACVSFNYPANTVKLAYADLMSSTLGIETDLGDSVQYLADAKSHLRPTESMHVEEVNAVTMTWALEAAGAPSTIGLLSLDVEGVELEVLQGIDFGKYQFKWLLIESRNVERISDFLEPQGFLMHSQLSHHDYLFASLRT